MGARPGGDCRRRAAGGGQVKSRVAVVRCEDYDESRVQEAVAAAVELLGGAAAFAAPGERILCKPNLLAADPPERATTTHPLVHAAVVRIFSQAGAAVEFGDSPGFGSPASVANKSGITRAAVRAGGRPADFAHQANLPLPSGNSLGLPALPVAKSVVDCDGVVSVSKLKTHGLMRMTGAVKNQLGCVFGYHKARMHLIGPDAESLGRILVDIDSAVAPRLYVMDAVVAMEGNGPRSGTPRRIGLILASVDPVALDTTACRLIDLDPAHVPTIVAGAAAGRGTRNTAEIELLGDPVNEFIRRDFAVVRAPASHHMLTRPAILKRLLAPRPVIDPAACTRCGVCVEACPVPGKAVQFRKEVHDEPPAFNYNECIRCFCCQEMCPHEAIRIHTPLAGRVPAIRRRVGR